MRRSQIVPQIVLGVALVASCNVWFHMNNETDWRVDSSTAAKNAFVTMANDPYFNPRPGVASWFTTEGRENTEIG